MAWSWLLQFLHFCKREGGGTGADDSCQERNDHGDYYSGPLNMVHDELRVSRKYDTVNVPLLNHCNIDIVG